MKIEKFFHEEKKSKCIFHVTPLILQIQPWNSVCTFYTHIHCIRIQNWILYAYRIAYRIQYRIQNRMQFYTILYTMHIQYCTLYCTPKNAHSILYSILYCAHPILYSYTILCMFNTILYTVLNSILRASNTLYYAQRVMEKDGKLTSSIKKKKKIQKKNNFFCEKIFFF